MTNKPKTIVQIVQHLKPGGLEVMVLELMCHSDFHQQMKIISLEGDRDTALKRWPRLVAHQDKLIFLNKQSGFSLSLLMCLTRTLRQLNADVVHTHHIGPYLYGGLAAKLASVPHMHTEHDAWHYRNPRHRLLHKVISSFSAPKAVADADIVATNMATQLGITKPNVIKNGIDTQKFVPGDKHTARQNLGLPEQVTLIGSSGRLEAVKGHSVLIQAMAQMPPEFHLAIAGSGTLQNKLSQQVEQLELQDRVHFLGHLDDMPTFYQSLDLFCLPSFNEGFPLAPLEAQSCGIKAAVTDVGGATETLCPESGVALPVGNADMMATLMQANLQQPPHANPRQFILSHANVRVMANAYDSLAKELCYGV